MYDNTSMFVLFLCFFFVDNRNVVHFGVSGIKQQLVSMNFFVKETRTSQRVDAQELAVISTRVYIVLFIICILVLGFFNGLAKVTVTENVLSPSIGIFEKLHAMYPNTLSCACQQITIPYGSFLTVKPVYHQVSYMN
jgi:hypothetical protein